MGLGGGSKEEGARPAHQRSIAALAKSHLLLEFVGTHRNSLLDDDGSATRLPCS